MSESTRSAADVLGSANLQPFDEDDLAELDGALITDAIVIFRYQHPDWPNPRIMWSTTIEMSDTQCIGMLTIVLDRRRDLSRAGWTDDQ